MARKSPDEQETTENPRTARVRKIVLEAATDLLIAEGHHAVTPQRVSTVTGVARSTIYRIWPDPVSLLLDAIDRVLAPDHAAPTIGDLRVDLANALESLRLRLNRRPFRVLFVALLDHATRSSDLIPAQRRFVAGVTAPLRGIVAGAIEDGRLGRSIKPDEAVAQLAGPIFHQHVMRRARISDELIANTVDGFVTSHPVQTTRGDVESSTSSR